jgi:hypothetical protein
LTIELDTDSKSEDNKQQHRYQDTVTYLGVKEFIEQNLMLTSIKTVVSKIIHKQSGGSASLIAKHRFQGNINLEEIY